MSDYVHIGHEECPECFTFGLAQGTNHAAPPLLILGVTREVLPRLVADLSKSRMIGTCKELLQECGADAEFLLDTNKPWGFGGVLEPYLRASRDDGNTLVEYAISIPQVEKDAGICTYCNGTKEDDFGDCLRCEGTGRKTVREQKDVDRIVATLCVLGSATEFPNKEWLVGVSTKR